MEAVAVAEVASPVEALLATINAAADDDVVAQGADNWLETRIRDC